MSSYQTWLVMLAVFVPAFAGCGKQADTGKPSKEAEQSSDKVIFDDTMGISSEKPGGVGLLSKDTDRKVSIVTTSEGVPINVYFGLPGKGRDTRMETWEKILASKERSREAALGATIPAGKNAFLLIVAPESTRVKIRIEQSKN